MQTFYHVPIVIEQWLLFLFNKSYGVYYSIQMLILIFTETSDSVSVTNKNPRRKMSKVLLNNTDNRYCVRKVSCCGFSVDILRRLFALR